MRNIVFLLLILFVIFLVSFPGSVAPKNYFHISKEERLKVVEKLKNDCTSDNPMYLIATYADVLNDLNTSQCWAAYRDECQKRVDNNLSLKVPINCLVY